MALALSGYILNPHPRACWPPFPWKFPTHFLRGSYWPPIFHINKQISCNNPVSPLFIHPCTTSVIRGYSWKDFHHSIPLKLIFLILYIAQSQLLSPCQCLACMIGKVGRLHHIPLSYLPSYQYYPLPSLLCLSVTYFDPIIMPNIHYQHKIMKHLPNFPILYVGNLLCIYNRGLCRQERKWGSHSASFKPLDIPLYTISISSLFVAEK